MRRTLPARRTWRIALALLLVGLAAVSTLASTRTPARASGPVLTNLAHLDFLHEDVAPPSQARHTTYRLDAEPDVGALWTYADRQADGTYRRVGGGSHDAQADTWSQGAFNADDMARASVVYLRHWQQFGDAHSRRLAYQMLRGVTYLQTASGPNAGNVVLWMQPDGTLNPSAEPVELPDPSDSGPSYWLARTVWALGEGYAAFADDDPAFAGFLRRRLDLAVDALERQVLDRYGEWEVADGERVPAWLVVDGADASAEAVLGLTAYAQMAPPGATARASRAAAELSEGIAAMSTDDPRSFPYGAILPWTHSRSMWHAWASQMPAALARASQTLGRSALLTPAVRDAGSFTPYLLTSTGAVNGLLPGPSDRTQIAYGVDSRLQSLLAVGDASHAPGLRDLAAVDAAWYFGANPAGTPMYDPATGRTFDGINGDGVVNRNSGAESTIHGLLSMLALDARADVARSARDMTAVTTQDGVDVVEAESARTSGAVRSVQPDAAWTGESLWSGSYLEMGAGGAADWSVPAVPQARLVAPVVEVVNDPRSAVTEWSGDGAGIGSVRSGGGGEQGVSEAPGALLPRTLAAPLPAGATGLRTEVSPGAGGPPARLDAVLLRPVVSRLVLSGSGGGAALVQSARPGPETVTVDLPGSGVATVRTYDGEGRLRDVSSASGTSVPVPVVAGGFSIARR